MNEAAPSEQPPAEKLEHARRDPLASPALGTASRGHFSGVDTKDQDQEDHAGSGRLTKRLNVFEHEIGWRQRKKIGGTDG
jgi:hypothetical protein